MRAVFLVLAATSCLATPALAQARETRAAERLSDPAVQDGIAAAVSALADIVLDTRVGSLARYSDGRIRPGDTLREVKRREDPGFERRLRRDTRRAVGDAGAMARDATAAAGAVTQTAIRLRAALAPLTALSEGDPPRDDYED